MYKLESRGSCRGIYLQHVSYCWVDENGKITLTLHRKRIKEDCNEHLQILKPVKNPHKTSS